jgi:fatty acid-binding protein DegV
MSGGRIRHSAHRFSSALSGSVGSAKVAAEGLAETYPDKQLSLWILFRPLSARVAGLQSGSDARSRKISAQTADWVETNKLHFCINSTVDDLNHLARGGRLKKSAAILGTMMQLKTDSESGRHGTSCARQQNARPQTIDSDACET